LFKGRHATGVDCIVDGVRKQFFAGREVILTAGAINSPQLLQLSGIGPEGLLREHGVDVVDHRPGVGGNLQDHYQVRHVMRCTRPITLNDKMASLAGRIGIGIEYVLHRRGALTVSAGQAGVFARTRPDLASPDMQIHFMTLSTDQPGKSLHDFSGFTSSVCQLRPESRGVVQIAGNDPLRPPRIEARYLSAETDRRTIVDAIRLNRKILSAPALAELIAEEVRPGPHLESDDELLAFAQQTGSSIFHPVGTCKMGSDPMAVVDSQLRVHGIKGLRVADASIMPTLISGNTNAPAIMIGEKAADLIASSI